MNCGETEMGIMYIIMILVAVGCLLMPIIGKYHFEVMEPSPQISKFYIVDFQNTKTLKFLNFIKSLLTIKSLLICQFKVMFCSVTL